MDALFDRFVNILTLALLVALFGRMISSWFTVGRDSPFFPVIEVLYQVTEPILAPIRRVLPKFGMLDFSPMIAFFVISLIRSALI